MTAHPAQGARRCLFARAGLLLAFALFCSGTARADNLFVDCSGATPGAFSTITAALNSLPLNSTTEPHSIDVSGTCTEVVRMNGRQRVTIQRAGGAATATIVHPAGPLSDVVNLQESRDITLRNLVIQGGGQGVRLIVSTMRMQGCTVENSAGSGINVNPASTLRLDSSTIQNNGGQGFVIFDGSTVLIGGPSPAGAVTISGNGAAGIRVDRSVLNLTGNVTIENNGGLAINMFGGQLVVNGAQGENIFRNNGGGINVQSAAGVIFNGQNTIQNNGGSGLQIVASSVTFNETQLPDGTPRVTIIEGHTDLGVNMVRLAELSINGGHKIRNNSSLTVDPVFRSGIRVSRSSLSVGGAEITNNGGPGILADINSSVALTGGAMVTNNAEEGLRVLRTSVAFFFAPGTLTGNGGASISCDTTALVAGDLTGITQVNCPRIERAHGPPRPGVIQQ